jgi:hypothetical protein
MKKIFYLMSLLALALVSCNKEEPFKLEQTEDGQYVYRFTVNNEHAAWKAGDQLAVFDEEGTILGLAELSESSAGQTKGAFSLTIEPLLADGTKLLFQYPYVEEAEILTGQVAVKQTSSLEGVGAGANGLASAEVDFKQQNLEVTLAPVHAYVKLNVSSSAFADYTLEGATLWAAESQLSGNVALAEGEPTVTKPADYVKTTVAEPAAVGAGANALVLATLPADLTGKTVWAIVHMSKGIETVTIPVQITEPVVLEAGKVKEIALADLTAASAPAWYQPIETRYVAAYGDAWSYGPENTVLFTESGQEKTVELKARGNFMKVKKPAAVKINNVSDQAGMKADAIFVNDVDGNGKTTVALDANCSVKVKMNAISNVGYCGSMLVLDEAGKTIWGINLWLSHDGVGKAAYADGEVLDRNIGSSKISSVSKHYTCNGVYFQWGRPFGFPWSTSNKGTTHAPTTYANDLTKSAENPFTMFRYDNGGNGPGFPWDYLWGDGDNKDRSCDLDDLWGNPQENVPVLTSTGKKSNLDPCPKGYRVASAAIIDEVFSKVSGEVADGVFTSTATDGAEIVTDNTTHHYVVYKGISWGFGGIFAPTNGMNKIDNGKFGTVAFWSNANHGANGHHMYFRIKYSDINKPSGPTAVERTDKRTKAAATPIRCMVDTENR